ncbi:MAG: hypothetical protein J2O46_04895 [Nocardioides sp.]|nr:hypothetical protein [Nocardioides sp.]
MTRTVYLHVGAPKSGAKYVRQVLDGNRKRLADNGVLVVGEQVVDRVHAAYQVRKDPRLKLLPESRRNLWPQLVEEIAAWDGESAILSYELLAAATARQAARALTDLADFDSHVVITARDLGRTVPSAWQERLKFGFTTPLEEWEPPSVENQRGEWGWRTTDPASVAERWGAAVRPDRVHIVTVPRSREDPTVLWHRFADACGVGGIEVDVSPARVNESLGAVEAELLRRVNGHLRTPLDNDRELSVWIRDLLADRVLAGHGHGPLGITEEQYAEAGVRADAAIEALADAGYVVHGDLEDLRATRPTGRMPGSVSESELLDGALETIVDLVLLLRESSETETPPPVVTPGARTVPGFGGRLRRLLGGR